MGTLKVEHVVVSLCATNCYILFDDQTLKGCIIDPGESPARIEKKVSDLGLSIECIILTHGHFDHIGACPEIRKKMGCEVIALKEAAQELRDIDLNLTGQMEGVSISVTADKDVSDGDILDICGHKCKVIHTPGHTPGSMCLYFEEEKILIAGDTLFCESLGRFDLPGGDGRKIIASITNKLFTLPEDTVVYPGHGETTTIGHELKYNPCAEYIGQF